MADRGDGQPEDPQRAHELLAQLRDANQNLLIAAVDAQARRDEAEAANRRQNEFLAMLAHELRNPLAPIGMAAALLERLSGVHPDLPRLHGVIQRQVEQMARLLDDLLDAARVSSGKIVLRKKVAALAEVIERAVETVQPKMHQRQQQLRVSLPDQALAVECDPARLAQVFSNLLWNASKFTQEGGAISLSVEPDGQGARVIVEDNGIGITPDLLPQVFELFLQGPRGLARSEGGMGIGLSVVRSLVKMHDGTVEAWSEGSGKGSRFTVTLPCARPEDIAQDGRRSGKASARARVLLIEDSADASAMLRELLTLEGHSVSCAATGPDGLAMALADVYDVVVCDIGLPGMDGYQVAQQLRARHPHPPPRIVALSGYGGPEDRSRAERAGFDHYLVKPVDPDALLMLLGPH